MEKKTLSLALALLVGAAACIAPSAPPALRHFAPPAGGPPPPEPSAAVGVDQRIAVRLRPVRAAGHLREKLAWRGPGAERGVRELERWSEPPVEYLLRALWDAVGADPRLVRSEAADAWTLAVYLEAFEEVRGPSPRAEVVVRGELVAPDGRLWQGRQSAVEELSGGTGEELATALGISLGAALRELLAGLLGESLGASGASTSVP